MSNVPIYVDADRAAVLEHGANTVNCFTLQEAIVAFNNLPSERQEIATITSAGQTFTPAEIGRLHKAKPATTDETEMPETPKGSPFDGSPV